MLFDWLTTIAVLAVAITLAVVGSYFATRT
jgi:hypothetical protein